MKKIVLITVFIITAAACFSENSVSESPSKPVFFFEGGIGTSYSFYSSANTDTMVGIIDTGGYSRVPLYFNVLAGLSIYDNLSVLLTVADVFDRFSFSSDYLQLNTLQIYPGLQYISPVKGLMFELGWGLALLLPDTNMSYNGGIEQGSVVQFSAVYQFYQLNGRLLPKTGLRISHSELINSKITSLILFINLSWK